MHDAIRSQLLVPCQVTDTQVHDASGAARGKGNMFVGGKKLDGKVATCKDKLQYNLGVETYCYEPSSLVGAHHLVTIFHSNVDKTLLHHASHIDSKRVWACVPKVDIVISIETGLKQDQVIDMPGFRVDQIHCCRGREVKGGSSFFVSARVAACSLFVKVSSAIGYLQLCVDAVIWFVVGLYVVPHGNSQRSSIVVTERSQVRFELDNLVHRLKAQVYVILVGDLNARIRCKKRTDDIKCEGSEIKTVTFKQCDPLVNSRGKWLLDMLVEWEMDVAMGWVTYLLS